MALILLATPVLFAQKKRETIYVEGTDVFSTCHERIILRGVNEMFIWSNDKNGSEILPEISKTGANAVRLVWTTKGNPSELDELITNCIHHKMIAIPELHDATGNFGKLQQCVDYWKREEVVKIIQKHKKWIIVNIANEVGFGFESDKKYLTHYTQAISELRKAGIDVPLMIDAGGWGNHEEYVVNNGTQLLTSDSLHNLIFSVHTYWKGNNQTTRLDQLITDMAQRKLCLVIGEGPQMASSPQTCHQLFPYQYLMEKCHQNNIGWLSWSWGAADNKDCGSPDSVFDMTTDGRYGNWATAFAEEICVTSPFSIQNTSVKPFSLSEGYCPK